MLYKQTAVFLLCIFKGKLFSDKKKFLFTAEGFITLKGRKVLTGGYC